MQQLENDIAAMEELVAGFDARFAKADPADYAKARALSEEYESLKADLRALYSAWEELAAQVSA
jgi:hypothetical protein